MSTLKALVGRLKATLLDRMTSSNAGTFNLPVEIWREIFTVVCAAIVAPALIENELHGLTKRRSACSYSTPTVTSDFFLLQSPNLFKARYTFIRVCKSWYFIAIPLLQAHIRIRHKDTNGIHASLYSALKRNQTFAKSVVRLSIERALDFWSGDIRWGSEQEQGVKDIISIIPNLRILTCPYYLAGGFQPTFSPESVIIYDEAGRGRMRQTKVPQSLESHGVQFWYTAHTLSLSFICEPSFPSTWHQNNETSPPFFPNLVTLNIDVENVDTIKWIVTKWLTPVLRSLTIISPYPGMWIEHICHHANVLEHLSVLLRSRLTIPLSSSYDPPSFPISPLVMPKLKSFCLSFPDNIEDRTLTHIWFSTVRAPKLEHFSYHIRVYVHMYAFLRQMVHDVFHLYPSLRSLGICDTRWISNVCDELDIQLREGTPILTTQDIINWCDRVQLVEISGVRTKRNFTKESLMALILERSLD